MSSPPTPDEIDAALETLSRALQPDIATPLKELLKVLVSVGATEPSPAALSEDRLNDLVQSLSSDVAEGGLLLFEALQSDRREIDSITLADRAGVSTRELSGRIIRPLQEQVIDKLGLATPWAAIRAAPSGGVGARTIWRVVDRENSRVLYEAFKKAAPAPSERSSARAVSPRVLPAAVFPYAPEYALGATQEGEGWSSCLRDSEPGSRAVIYRVHSDQGIVALFDIEQPPKEDRDWGYGTEGYFTQVKPPITRAKLLADPTLEPIFRHIQGRRRLPPAAQAALAELIEKETKKPLPDHSLTRKSEAPRRRR